MPETDDATADARRIMHNIALKDLRSLAMKMDLDVKGDLASPNRTKYFYDELTRALSHLMPASE